MSEEVKEVKIETSGKVIQSPCGPIIHGLEDVLVKTTTISDIDGKTEFFGIGVIELMT